MLKAVNSVFDSLTERQTSLAVHINRAHPVLVERMDHAGSRGPRRTFDGNCEALSWLLQPANMSFRLLYLCIAFFIDNHLCVCGLSVWLCAVSASRNTCEVSYQEMWHLLSSNRAMKKGQNDAGGRPVLLSHYKIALLVWCSGGRWATIQQHWDCWKNPTHSQKVLYFLQSANRPVSTSFIEQGHWNISDAEFKAFLMTHSLLTFII